MKECYNHDLIGMIYVLQVFDFYHCTGHPFVIIVVDVNLFIGIINNFGQTTGDTIFRNIAPCLYE